MGVGTKLGCSARAAPALTTAHLVSPDLFVVVVAGKGALLCVQRSEGHLQGSVFAFSSKTISPTLFSAGWGGDKVSCPQGP